MKKSTKENKKRRCLTLLLMLFFTVFCSAQSGVVSGVLEDDSGMPLPGVNILVEGTNLSTITDFDGLYSIACEVGDILVFSFIGMQTKKIKVTSSMFGEGGILPSAPKKPISPIFSKAYGEAVKKVSDSSDSVNFFSIPLKYNKQGYFFKYEKIKNIEEKNGRIKITYFNPEIKYKVNFNSTVSFQFVDRKHTPKLQNSFAQGRPENGMNQWFGPETGELFSYGPNVNSLAFDGSNYQYDTHGRLINGVPQDAILPYDNQIFKTAKTLTNNLTLAASNNTHSLNLNLLRKSQNDLFGVSNGGITQFQLNYRFKRNHSAFFNYNDNLNRQPNVNGFYSNVLLAAYATPNSFENKQGYIFNDDSQRSFSPDQFNNPFWLLRLNQNKNQSYSMVFGSTNKFNINDNFYLNTILNFNRENTNINFALPFNTIGFIEGYRSKKHFSKDNLTGYFALNYNLHAEDFSWINMESSVKFLHSNLDYSLLEESNFSTLNFSNPSNSTFAFQKVQNTTLRLGNEVKFDLDVNFEADITLRNNSVISQLQGRKWFLPSAQVYCQIYDPFNSNWFRALSFASGISREASETPLYYSNLSHNTLNITPIESPSLLANNDLFNSKALDFETATTFDFETTFNLFHYSLNLGINYYLSKSENTVFPVYENGSFQLQNAATISNRGLELSLTGRIGNYYNNFRYSPTLLFSRNRGRVLSLANNRNILPIAGFKNISKNLIVGKQTGTLVGSAFLRDENGRIIIDNSGYPLVNPQQSIIGNTTPDFNLSLDNDIEIGKFKINFLIDYQCGGDVWSGTKNVLNYLGRSQESAILRTTTNYIFSGVNQSGNTNTVAVDFANPNQDVSENRWVRYGFDGVDEEAIVNGTFINLKSFSVAYDFAKKENSDLFREFKISVYGSNLLVFTKTSGVAPYSSLFNYTSGKGLDYFNMPLIKELGFKISIKI